MLGDAAGLAARPHWSARMASSSDVLPWSTWPMMVTTGGRGCSVVRVVGDVEQAFLDVGFGDALDRVAEFLGDELGGVGVDHVGDLRHLALLHQQLDDVDGALRHAVGEFLDGDRLGDGDFARRAFPSAPLSRWPVMRCTRRRNAATERSRSSSALSAVVRVRRPRRCLGAPGAAASACGAGGGTRRGAASDAAAGAALRRRRLRGVTAARDAAPRRRRGVCGVVVPRRRSASWRPRSARRLVSSSWRRRSSSSRLRASAASRSLRSTRSRSARRLAPLPRRSCALPPRAPWRRRAHARARSCSSSVSVRSTTPDGFGGGAAEPRCRDGRRPRAGRAAAARRRARPARRRARPRPASLARAADAALHLLDHHRLGAAMAEALAHHALLDARA